MRLHNKTKHPEGAPKPKPGNPPDAPEDGSEQAPLLPALAPAALFALAVLAVRLSRQRKS